MPIRGKSVLRRRINLGVLAGAIVAFVSLSAHAGDLRIKIPRRSRPTPVQRLNQEGVEAVKKHQYDKAKALFYQAYLFDPGDPFTLNNLGFVAELEGQVERAQSFYSLAAAQPTEALVSRASSPKLEGVAFTTAVSSDRNATLRINRANAEAVRLLSEGRVPEADLLLHQTLALDPNNAFTLNNLGVAKESRGEYDEALRYYDTAAAANVEDPVIVTMNAAWRGKPLSEMARASATRLRSIMTSLESTEAKVAALNLRGVSAVNRNDWHEARKNFSEAYRLGPHNAFALNNQGFLAEMDGDLETAQGFYREAQSAGAADARVGAATRSHAEGMKLFSVAEESESQVSTAIDVFSEARHRNRGPIVLKRRDGTLVVEPPTPPPQANSPQPNTSQPNLSQPNPPQANPPQQ